MRTSLVGKISNLAAKVVVVTLLLQSFAFLAPSALAAGTVEDNVLGQPDFTSSSAATTATGLGCPTYPTYDSTNKRLFVADDCNNRVLVYDLSAGITDGMAASHVLGQLNFTSGGSGTTQTTLFAPRDTYYDTANQRLFVADTNNSRVLVFDLSAGITDGMAASNVIGESDFVTSNPGTTQTQMQFPYGISYDPGTQTLFVDDRDNSRVLTYDLSGGIPVNMAATNVIGQSNFTSSTLATTQTGLDLPEDVTVDPGSHTLFVSDSHNQRVLSYDITGGVSNGMAAAHVLGQPDFTTASTPGASANTFSYPAGMAYDAGSSRLFVADATFNRVLSFDFSAGITDNMAAAHVLGQSDFTSSGAGLSQESLSFPLGVSYDPAGGSRLFVAEFGNKRVVVFGAPPGHSNATSNGKVVLSREKVNATADVTVSFHLPDAHDGSATTITFPAGFTVTSNPTAPASSACLGGFGHTSSTAFATKNTCGSNVNLVIGGFQVTNPGTPGSYLISWINDDPGGASVYIMSEDQISMSATVNPSITFDVGADTSACNAGWSSSTHTVAFGSLTPSSVSYSDNGGVQHICTKLSTNAAGGATVTVMNANGASGLASASVPGDTIPSASGAMSVGVAKYGLCSTSTHGLDVTVPVGASPTNGSFSASSCGTGTATIVAFTGGIQTAWTAGGPVSNGFYQFDLNAEASATTPAHSDYSDTLTWIATGTF